MGRKRYTVEQIIHKLREAEVELSQGKAVGHVVSKQGITEQTYYRWRREYNTLRPHSSLGYIPPAPEAIEPLPQSSGTTSLHSGAGNAGLT
jgi:transposase InsO family protein